MNTVANNILLIAGDSADAPRIQEALAESGSEPFKVEWVRQLTDGLARLSKGGVEAILLELLPADIHSIETFDKLLLAAHGVPILVLAGEGDENIARQAIERGANDYLLKGRFDSYSLQRSLHNMIERRRGEEALFIEKERAQVTLNSIGDAVLSTDISGNVSYLNVVAESMTGWSCQEALGRPLDEVFRIIDGVTREIATNPLDLAVKENRTVCLAPNCILVRRDGFEAAIENSASPIHDRKGRVTGAVIIFHDVSAKRETATEMSHLAHYDYLTDLPNRMLLKDRLTQAISSARRNGNRIGVLFLDLDQFKHINDSLGHAVGDQVLQSVAKRLTACVRRSDTVSRQGGDEFVVLLPELEHVEDAGLSAKKVLNALSEPHRIAEHDLHVSVSIGVSIYPDDGQNAETLIQHADTAMYQAKANGRDNYQFFKKEMNIRAIERQSLEGSLRRALERAEFVLHYQPKINLETGAITGAEALLRWQHPDRGLLTPSHFVPIAEDCGLIVPIGQWVLREACKQSRAWLDAGLRPTPVSVNVSALEFRDKHFLENVCAILKETRLEPRFLELEMTESVLMARVECTACMLGALKVIGVRLTVDDFGTGYSSLSYLNRFPLDALKLDRSFVHEITSPRANNAAIVRAVITMGKSLRQRVIAEGVETREELAFLRDQHCDEGQGYYFSRPVAGDEFAKLLEADEPLTIVNR
ncbi:MAG: EAL domain-containing protein [Acidobacteriia bacterium]|nr:EAL domain-containing protein [Terriglobia bacterium]